MSDAENTIATLRSRGYQITGVGSAMMALAIIAVALRLYAKSKGDKKHWGWDDVLIVLALMIYVTDEALILYAVNQGTRAVNAESPEWSTFSLFVFIYSIMYWTIIAFTTYSILFLYRRIFYTQRLFTIASIAIASVVTVWWISGTILDGLAYQPAKAFWDSSVTGGYVINYNDFWIGDMIIELFFEAAVILLPLMEVLKLNLNTKKKAFMATMFAMGGFVLITGILRIHYAWKSSDMIPGTIWLGVHGSVAIISACLPTYRPLLSRIPGLLPTTRHGDSTMQDGSWRSRRKDSINATVNDNETLKNSQSFDEQLLHQPQSLADLQLHQLETGRKFSLSPASHNPINYPVIEEETTQSQETLQGSHGVYPPPTKPHFL